MVLTGTAAVVALVVCALFLGGDVISKLVRLFRPRPTRSAPVQAFASPPESPTSPAVVPEERERA